MADRILIVEDEEKLAGLLRDYLKQEGFEVAVLHRGDEVEDWIRAHPTDLVLLDLMLPGKNGLEICKALRASGAGLSIIMVTARVDEIDRLLGLELGNLLVERLQLGLDLLQATLVPVRHLRADEHANDDDDKLDRDRGPVLGAQIGAETAQDHDYPHRHSAHRRR